MHAHRPYFVLTPVNWMLIALTTDGVETHTILMSNFSGWAHDVVYFDV